MLCEALNLDKPIVHQTTANPDLALPLSHLLRSLLLLIASVQAAAHRRLRASRR